MKTVRVFLPHGAHIRFDGVDVVQTTGTEYITFRYLARNEKGEATDKKAHAVINTAVAVGYSVEENAE